MITVSAHSTQHQAVIQFHVARTALTPPSPDHDVARTALMPLPLTMM